MSTTSWSSTLALPLTIFIWIVKGITTSFVSIAFKLSDFIDFHTPAWIRNANFGSGWCYSPKIILFILYALFRYLLCLIFGLFVGFFTILNLPHAYYLQRQSRLKEAVANGYIRIAPEPEPLPLQSLRRRVSHTRMNFASRDNEKVGLLSLPREVREMIWQELGFGEGKIIHWFTEKGRLRGCVCYNPEMHSFSSRGRGQFKWWSTFHAFGPELKVEAWGLLGSCRHLYIEIVEILYTRNTFVTGDPDVLIYLDHFLPPQRISQLRHLKFHWELGSPPSPSPRPNKFYVKTPRQLEEAQQKTVPYWDSWFRVWKNLGEMHSLVSLRMELDIASVGQPYWMPHELEIARELRSMENFELVIPVWFKSRAEKLGVFQGTKIQVLEFGEPANSEATRRFPW